jgi:hypothetical protein
MDWSAIRDRLNCLTVPLRVFCASAAAYGPLAKLLADLIGHSIELAMPLAIGFVK